jgi:hypothetical protein
MHRVHDRIGVMIMHSDHDRTKIMIRQRDHDDVVYGIMIHMDHDDSHVS